MSISKTLKPAVGKIMLAIILTLILMFSVVRFVNFELVIYCEAAPCPGDVVVDSPLSVLLTPKTEIVSYLLTGKVEYGLSMSNLIPGLLLSVVFSYIISSFIISIINKKKRNKFN